MARRRGTGQVVEKRRESGVTYGARFPVPGHGRQYVTFGTEAEGWTYEKAEAELNYLVARVARGDWQPPAPPPVVEEDPDPSFHVFISEWWARRKHELAAKTVLDYEWRMGHLLLFFRHHQLSSITPREVDRFRHAQVRAGKLSAESINKLLKLLAMVLEQAVEYELIDRNPAVGKHRRLRAPKPRRSYLDTSEHISALLIAAGELDRDARRDRQHVPRRAIIAVLTFSGLRLGELLGLKWRDVDLASGRLHVASSKTDAGRRAVKLRPILAAELRALKARSSDTRPDTLVFASGEGSPLGPSNLRRRVLAKAVERANEQLVQRGSVPLPAISPHSLRRTFASLLYALGEPPPVVMAEMGHTDPSLALSIYAQAMRRDDGEQDRLKALVEGADVEAPTGTKPESRDDGAPEPEARPAGLGPATPCP